MTPYITEQGSLIVHDEEYIKDPLVFTQKLLDFLTEIDAMIKTSFDDLKIFNTARDHSFKDFMNENMCTPNYLAIFIDNEMTKGMKGISNE